MFNYDLNEIGNVTFQLNFDDDYYNEWLSENGVTDSQQARFSFVRDCCDYDVEYTDSETYHHLGYATMTIDEIENVFGQKMAMNVLRSCMDGNEHTFEPLEYQNDEVDLNDPKQLSDAAMKYLKYGKYFKGARGFILPNGVVVYTDSEHNMCTRIPGVNGTYHFIDLGCIRVLPNSLDMAKMPTTEQFNTMYQVLRCYEDSELYLDLMNKQIGNFSKKYTYYDPDDVVLEIERYFKGGNMRNNPLYEITRKDLHWMINEVIKRIKNG